MPLPNLSLTTITGDIIPLADYRGQVLLVVNVASKCGFTPQYEGLEALHRRFHARGFSVLRDLTGHGIGRRIHEPPTVPSWDAPWARQPLTPGLVMTIEPIIGAGGREVVEAGDGWTIRTADGARSAHAEHTVVITDGAPLVLTAA